MIIHIAVMPYCKKSSYKEAEVENERPPLWRGVNLSRLGNVLQNGVDVEPPDAVFWAADIGKAMEQQYGGDNKLILAFNIEKVKPSWVSFKHDELTKNEIAELRKRYPTQVRRENGVTRLSRLPAEDGRAGDPKETIYGYWLPEPGPECLHFAAIIGSPEFCLEFASRLHSSVRSSRDIN